MDKQKVNGPNQKQTPSMRIQSVARTTSSTGLEKRAIQSPTLDVQDSGIGLTARDRFSVLGLGDTSCQTLFGFCLGSLYKTGSRITSGYACEKLSWLC